MRKNKALVAIFGRTNVGKSTLFNRLTESNHAMVSPIEGTTRDSNRAVVSWRNKEFELVDTGGIMDIGSLSGKAAGLSEADTIDIKVQKQASDYIKRADLIIFLVDAKAGILGDDRILVKYLKQQKLAVKTILAANKADSPTIRMKVPEFNSLGLGEPLAVSSANGSGTGDLLDVVAKRLKTNAEIIPPDKSEAVSVNIVGQPNVGKSSLLNALIGEQKLIVSPVPHTTREPQDSYLEHNGRRIRLVDTAGLSRQGMKAHKPDKAIRLEKMGIEKSLRNLKESKIALFVIDISERLTHQDSKIVEEIIRNKNSLIVVANKWDLIKEKDTEKFKQYIYSCLSFIEWAPIQFVSALTGEKVRKILDLVTAIDDRRKMEFSEKQLDRFLDKAVKLHRPPKKGGSKRPYLHKLKQTRSDPPKFELVLGANDFLDQTYVRFLENRLRKDFDIIGTPITIYVRKKRGGEMRQAQNERLKI